MSSQTLNVDDRLLGYILDTGVHESDIMRRLREETQSLEMGRMQISPEQGAFMSFIAQFIGAKRYVEIGTFTGYSMLSVASGMAEGFLAVACDVSKEWTDIARRYWKEAGIVNQVELKLAPALKTLSTLEKQSFDLAFIDADKVNYDAYYEACLELLHDKGLILIDNIFWGGDVANEQVTDPDTQAIRALNSKIMQDKRVKATMLTIGDGLMMIQKV